MVTPRLAAMTDGGGSALSSRAPHGSTSGSSWTDSLVQPKKPRRSRWESLKFRQDHRRRLPPVISRFLGYRPSLEKQPYAPLNFLPFSWLDKISLRYEVWIFGWIGAFTSILMIEAVMATNTAFREIWHVSMINLSFGASAVLVFGVSESPLAQPRNLVLGHFVSALVGTVLTRLFVLNKSYVDNLENTSFDADTFTNGGLSMATALLAQLMIGSVHPPGGAAALGAAVDAKSVILSWRYIAVVMTSAFLMLGWALIINNVGRRRYPLYWWTPEPIFVRAAEERPDDLEKATAIHVENAIREAEDGGRTREGLIFQRLEGMT